MPSSTVTWSVSAFRIIPRMKKPKFGPKRSSPSPPPCRMNPVFEPCSTAPFENVWLSRVAMSGPTPPNSVNEIPLACMGWKKRSTSNGVAAIPNSLFEPSVVFVRPSMRLGRLLWKGGDGRVIDGLGPDGVSATVIRVTKRVVLLQTGYVYHYAFAMLIGVAAFVTWYFAAGH